MYRYVERSCSEKILKYFLKVIIIGIIEKLDQGHLYPDLEVPGLTIPGRESNPGLPRGKRAL
jgi:hypothetical protein